MRVKFWKLERSHEDARWVTRTSCRWRRCSWVEMRDHPSREKMGDPEEWVGPENDHTITLSAQTFLGGSIKPRRCRTWGFSGASRLDPIEGGAGLSWCSLEEEGGTHSPRVDSPTAGSPATTINLISWSVQSRQETSSIDTTRQVYVLAISKTTC